MAGGMAFASDSEMIERFFRVFGVISSAKGINTGK